MIIGNYIITFRTPVHIKKAPYLKEMKAAIKNGSRLKALVICRNATGKSQWVCRVFVNKFLPEKNRFIIKYISKSNKNIMIPGNYIITFRTPVHIEEAPYLKEMRDAIKAGSRIKALVIYKTATGINLSKCRLFVNKFLPEKDKFIIKH